MHTFPARRHVPHWEYPGGTVCLTWRLQRDQSPLRHEERTVVLEVIKTGETNFAELLAVVVMDDHVHALVRPKPNSTAQRLATAWKGMSAHRLCADFGRVGPIWQRAYFDWWMRSPDHTRACMAYVIENPKRRWPDLDGYTWLYAKEPPKAP